jgi:hypothetical protein
VDIGSWVSVVHTSPKRRRKAHQSTFSRLLVLRLRWTFSRTVEKIRVKGVPKRRLGMVQLSQWFLDGITKVEIEYRERCCCMGHGMTEQCDWCPMERHQMRTTRSELHAALWPLLKRRPSSSPS